MSAITRRVIYIIISYVMVVVNVPLLCVILLRKRNRERREFLFIAGVAMGDMVYAAGFFMQSARRLEYYAKDDTEDSETERQWCWLKPDPFLLLLGITLIGQMNLMNAIDRFLATQFPIWYYRQDNTYTFLGLGIHYLWSLLIVLLNVLLVVFSEEGSHLVTARCFLSRTMYPGAKKAVTYYRWACVGISFIMYIVVTVSVIKRFTRFQNMPGVSKHNTKKLINTNITMGLTTVTTILFVLLPDVLLYSDIRFSSEVRTFFYAMILTKSFANFFLFVLRHSELRGILVGSMTSSEG